jgi:hypothetical protein
VKETTALWIFLLEILPASTRLTLILWRIDNMAALAHIRKEGGLRGRALLEGSERILLPAHQCQLRILPAFIPSEENVQADAALRFQLVSDWHLAPTVYLQISSLWGPSQIDLFASRQSAQTLRFMSWRATDNPEAIDSLSMRWDFKLAFLFPPIPLLKRVMRKLELSRGTFLLVAPYWEASIWFASLQALQVVDVRRLPFSDNLVINLSTGEPPPSLERLFLVVWKISGGLGESTPSRTCPSGLSRQDGSDPQRTAIKGLGSLSRPSTLFLHSSPSSVFEDNFELSYTPLRLWPFVDYHRHPQIHHFHDDGANRRRQGWRPPAHQKVDERDLQ